MYDESTVLNLEAAQWFSFWIVFFAGCLVGIWILDRAAYLVLKRVTKTFGLYRGFVYFLKDRYAIRHTIKKLRDEQRGDRRNESPN